MPVKDDALMFGAQQAEAHVAAHSPEADHSNLHVWCAPRVGLSDLGLSLSGLRREAVCFPNYERETGKDAGGSPVPIPWARINCRATPRMAGKRRAKMVPPARQVSPPMATVHGAPILAARACPTGALRRGEYGLRRSASTLYKAWPRG